MSKNLEIALLCDFYGELLTEKQRDCIVLYYDQDLSLGEIAENTGITRQGVRDSIKRGEATLLEMEEKLGLCRRYRQMYQGLERITQEAKNISLLNDNYNSSAEIERSVKAILETVNEIGE